MKSGVNFILIFLHSKHALVFQVLGKILPVGPNTVPSWARFRGNKDKYRKYLYIFIFYRHILSILIKDRLPLASWGENDGAPCCAHRTRREHTQWNSKWSYGFTLLFFFPFKPYYFILSTARVKFYAFITAQAHTSYTLNHQVLILNFKILNKKRI